MQSQRSAIDVVGRAARRVRPGRTVFVVSPTRVAPRPGRPPAVGTHFVRKQRTGAAWLALTLAVALLPSVGQAQTVEWARSAGGTGSDGARRIAVDDAGNTYVTGSFRGTATFGPFTLISSGSTEFFVAKYDTGGNVLWARSGGGTGWDEGFGIAADAAGNSYVTGLYQNTATFGAFTLTSTGGSDVFVVKYDGNGNVLWVQSAGGAAWDQGEGIAVDSAGNSHVTGRFQGTADFGPFTLTSTGDFDVFVAKYDTGGNVLWARSAFGPDWDEGKDIAVDAVGNSYLTGVFRDTATFGPFTLVSEGDEFQVFVAKYDSSGNVLWAQSAGGTSRYAGYGIGVDSAGSSYVTGIFRDTATFGPFTLTAAGGFDIFVCKYDGSGNVLWARSDGGTSGDEAYGIAVDSDGSSHVTGIFHGTATFGAFALTAAGSFSADIFVAKYDSSGNVLWAQSAGGPVGDGGQGIAVDAAGDSYVTGSFQLTATFDSFTLTSAGLSDIFVAKYNNCGNGTVDPGEECDGGLGCTDCLCDADFEPTSPPSLDCRPICGNGSVDPGEECDDGNTVDGDGCSSDCLREEACCLTDNSCQLIDVVSCAAQGGIAQGPGSTCGGTEACCDSPSGACYTADRTCCLANGDSPQGPGTACTAPQECCFSNNTCTNLDPLCCVDQGGTPQGAGSTCGTCGDGTCDCDEDFDSCCQDCPCPECTHCFEDCFGGGRVCEYLCATDCGDGTCDPACENCDTCPQDCGCDDCTTCNAATGTCDPDCGNGVCQTEVCFENCRTCPSDCACDDCDNCTLGGGCVSACGDGTCDPACESCSSCPQDCHECGDGCCTASAGETCCSCTQDCGACCGNDVCDTLCGEDCSNCPSDCLTEEPCDVPAVSEWGLMALVLLLLIGLAIKFGQYRRVPTDA